LLKTAHGDHRKRLIAIIENGILIVENGHRDHCLKSGHGPVY